MQKHSVAPRALGAIPVFPTKTSIEAFLSFPILVVETLSEHIVHNTSGQEAHTAKLQSVITTSLNIKTSYKDPKQHKYSNACPKVGLRCQSAKSQVQCKGGFVKRFQGHILPTFDEFERGFNFVDRTTILGEDFTIMQRRCTS